MGRSETFKKVEDVLQKYKYYKAKSEAEKEVGITLDAAASVNTDYSQPRPSNRQPSDITGNTAVENAKYITTESHKRFLLEIKKVEKVLNLLPPEEKQFVEIRYFNEYNDEETIVKLNRMGSSKYYRMKNRVMRKFALVLFGTDEI